jgi:hypothetical protein
VALLALREAAQSALSAARPYGASRAEWAEALTGLRAFLDQGWADQALLAGWSLGELFNVPERWSQIHLTGAGLLIGKWQVLAVDSNEIVVSPPWSPSSQLKFRRSDELRQLAIAIAKPEPAAEAPPAAQPRPRDLAAEEVAIARFKTAAEAVFGPGIEIMEDMK